MLTDNLIYVNYDRLVICFPKIQFINEFLLVISRLVTIRLLA